MRTFQTLVSASLLALAVPATSYFWYSVRSAIKDWLPARANSQPYELYANTTPNPEVEELLRDIDSPSDAVRSRAWGYIDRHQFEFSDDEEAKLAQACATLLREPRRLSEIRFIFTLDSFRYLSRERGARESCLSFLADNTLPLPLKDSEVLDLMNRETIEVRLALVRAVMAENGRAVPCQELEGLASRPGNSRFIQSARADLMTSISCRETFKEYFGRNADTEVLDDHIASPAANLLGHISSLRVGGPTATVLRPAFLRWQCKSPEACAAVVSREPDEVSRLSAQCVLRDLLPPEARTATDSAVQSMPMTELPTECMGHLDGSDPKLPEKLLELLRGNDAQRKSAALPIIRRLPQLLERSDELAEAAGEAFAVTWAFASRSDALLQQLSPRTREILENASRRSAHSLCGGRPCPDISHYLRPPGQSPAQFQQSILTVLGYLREAMIRGDARVERHAVADFLELNKYRSEVDVLRHLVEISRAAKRFPELPTWVLESLEFRDPEMIHELIQYAHDAETKSYFWSALGRAGGLPFRKELEENFRTSPSPNRRSAALRGLRCLPWSELKPLLASGLRDRSAKVQLSAAALSIRSAPTAGELRELFEVKFQSSAGEFARQIVTQYDYEPKVLWSFAYPLMPRELGEHPTNATGCDGQSLGSQPDESTTK